MVAVGSTLLHPTPLIPGFESASQPPLSLPLKQPRLAHKPDPAEAGWGVDRGRGRGRGMGRDGGRGGGRNHDHDRPQSVRS